MIELLSDDKFFIGSARITRTRRVIPNRWRKLAGRSADCLRQRLTRYSAAMRHAFFGI
jgi:hypothetical protein